MAWLNCPADRDEVTRRDFLDWVERYLLPNSGLPCTALELYSARCGVVHTQSPEARATRGGTARKIFYSWGSCRPDTLQAYINIADPGAAVAVEIELVVKAFELAVDRFVEESERVPDLAERVERRLQKIFCDIGPEGLPELT